jgi:hypothetical protein
MKAIEFVRKLDAAGVPNELVTIPYTPITV